MTKTEERRMSKVRMWLGGLVIAMPVAVQAQIDLSRLDREMSGARAQVLVLGTVHLSGLPASFNPSSLDTVLDRLAAFKPDIITIEKESGEECDMAARHPVRYGADYCPSTEAAQKATGLDIPAALAEADRTLKNWPAQPSPAQRRRLAALFLASNDRASAYVQWLLLPSAERHAGDSLNPALVEALDKVSKRNNEDFLIAAKLAARLGLQRVHPVDNHTGDQIQVSDTKALVRELEAAWATASPEYREYEKQENELAKAADLLPLYRMVNNPEHLRARAEANVLTTMRARSAQGYPQMWVAGWEVRNLRMVSNIRESFRERPAARVLTIVGATHKPWFDSWLGQLQGVDIVNVADVLL